MDMNMDITQIATGGVGAALAIAAALVWYLVRRRADSQDRKAAKRAALEEQLKHAKAEWAAAAFCGDPARVHATARKVSAIEKQIAKLSAIVLCALCAGCVGAKVETVVLSEHCRVVHPGDTVPDLPEGQPYYWLLTPKGLVQMLPASADVPDVTVED